MLTLLSPAKTFDESTKAPHIIEREPALLSYATELMIQLKSLSPSNIESLMKISEKLALLNFDRFQNFETPLTEKNAKPAIYLFKGDVYQGLDAYSMNQKTLKHLDEHLIILSGLYGALSPLDLIAPYRLEMGTPFINKRGRNLYEFWGTLITDHINQVITQKGYTTIINLASNEYFKAIEPKNLNANLITPIFKDLSKKGEYRVISFYAKKARGLMTRFMSEKATSSIDTLKEFNLDGYYLADEKIDELIFHRDH